MVHYCFNTQAVHCEKLSHLHGGTQWPCLCASESAASQDRCKHSMVHLLPAFHLHGCLGGAAGSWGTGLMHTSTAGQPWTCKFSCTERQGGFLSLVQPLLQASHSEKLRFDRANKSTLSWIIKTKSIFLCEVERRMGGTLPFLVWRTLAFLC